MEQTITDFFVKASELILHNRLPSVKTPDTTLNHILKSNSTKFQLNFDQKFNFRANIPSQWSSQSHKLLVIEFFLLHKTSNEKVLVEQWVFELNQITDKNKLKHTIDSTNSLYTRLSMLLRTISLLTVTLPLFKYFVNDKISPLSEYYTFEHSVHFSRHTLSNWHISILEDRSLGTYANPDLILPGRAFTFKVNYPKSFKFLQIIEDELMSKDSKQFQGLSTKLDMDYFNPNKKDKVSGDGNNQVSIASMRKSTSDTNKANISMGGNGSPREQEAISEKSSPFGSLLTYSPIETQKSPLHNIEGRPRKTSYPWENKTGSMTRPRKGTIDTEISGEYNMYIYEDPDGQFTEVLSNDELNTRNDLALQCSVHPKGSEDDDEQRNELEVSKDLEIGDLKLSDNRKPMEKLLEQTEDDKIAELIKVVDELKDFFHKYEDEEMNSKLSPKSVLHENGKKPGPKTHKGLLFYSIPYEPGNFHNNSPTLSSDYDELGNLYLKLKGQ